MHCRKGKLSIIIIIVIVNNSLLSAKQRALENCFLVFSIFPLLVQSLRKFYSFSFWLCLFSLISGKWEKRKGDYFVNFWFLSWDVLWDFACPEPSFLINQTWVFDIGRKVSRFLHFLFFFFVFGFFIWVKVLGFLWIQFSLYLLIDRKILNVFVLVIQ